jgi:hypothetical protein
MVVTRKSKKIALNRRLSSRKTRLKHCLLVLPVAFSYADGAASERRWQHMRFSIKRTTIKKRTPEQAERAYRQMIAEREAQKRDVHWLSIAMQVPRI